jgi:NAD(P)-dependent dehydrogenase (short-subunit alcohol dehydrogenase family)
MNSKQVTIITGGGRGIGRAIALRMSRLTSILVVGRTKEDLVQVCDEINLAGGAADYVVGDIGRPRTTDEVLGTINEHSWIVRNIVCNAGIGKGGPVVSFDADVWRNMFDVNVHGSFYIIKALLPQMIEQKGGSISIISSVSGLQGHKNEAAYSATKFALVGMAQSLADELKKHNIVVVPICPGFVDTEMTDRTIAGMCHHRGINAEKAREKLAAVNRQGCILKSEEIAEAVAYCAGPLGSPVSGQSMTLTGLTEPRVLNSLNWLEDVTRNASLLIVPISGGSDSAAEHELINIARPGRVLSVYAGKPKTLRCREWFESRGEVAYIAPGLRGLSGEIGRWARLQEMSHARRAWLVSSRNRTEDVMGTYSMASCCATLYPLIKLWKSQVMSMCEYLSIPSAITESSRRADPDCGRPTELAEIPLELIDVFSQVLVGELPKETLSQLTSAQQRYLSKIVDYNRFKGNLLKGPVFL